MGQASDRGRKQVAADSVRMRDCPSSELFIDAFVAANGWVGVMAQ
jgi:hypothetical protein